MRIPRFYVSLPLASGERVILPDHAYNHGVRVLRLKPGMELTLFNGEGGEYRAVLDSLERRQAVVCLGEYSDRDVESPLQLQLAQGISKGMAMDYALQKAVELGAGTLQPLWVERSVVNLQGERMDRRLEHWRGIVIGACEQCGRNILPRLLEPLPLSHWLRDPPTGMNLVLDPTAPRQGLQTLPTPTGAVTLLVGPEGGLAPEEIAQARHAGFIGVRLGPRVLRADTAGVAALAAIQTLWGDYG
ncbi:MAG: 16S rRNA (uracil(1498)-N(3))-methyltransferase [Gammaproteobacteria bacterium]|nr:16S rRNA (uracil(1498)-N(3))-methyltransferase [Gammaproteobacteria bacterium]MCP5459138.1 16S rRNA (uracil(1498)-N(3))-methyltransferase [Gammaproteobacteria bacterium]